MVLEVKKVVSSDIFMIDHSHLIELLLYVKYLISLNQLDKQGCSPSQSQVNASTFTNLYSNFLLMNTW